MPATPPAAESLTEPAVEVTASTPPVIDPDLNAPSQPTTPPHRRTYARNRPREPVGLATESDEKSVPRQQALGGWPLVSLLLNV
eukprot:6180111-Pleurochrysis_carterae.AAC.1